MNIQKLLLATIAGFVVMFMLGGAWHMMLMEQWYRDHAGLAKNIERPEPILWLIALGTFLLSAMMAYIYPKGVESSNKMMEGLKFGAMMGFIAFAPLEIILYGATTILSKMALMADIVFQVVNCGIGGIVIAMVYGDSVKAK